MAADEAAHLFRYREGDHEMMSRQLPADLCFQPLAGFVMLACGAMPVATGAINQTGVSAFGTFVVADSGLLSAACHDGIDGFAMLRRHALGKALDIVWAEGLKDLTYRSHGRILSWSG